MLKLVLKNIKKMYPYSFLSKLRKGYYLLPNNIFEKQFVGQHHVMKSTDSKDKDHMRMCDKCNKIIEYTFGTKPYPDLVKGSKHTQREKCEKLIAQVFAGVQQPALDIHGRSLEPGNFGEANAEKSHIVQCKAPTTDGDDSTVHSSTTKEERQKLPQKIEKIEEPSVVEADPLSVGFIQKKATELQNTSEDEPKDPGHIVNAEPQVIVQAGLPEEKSVPENAVTGITTFKSNEETIQNCNFARSDGNRKSGTSDYENLTTTNRIDERIIKEMEKLGVPQTSPKETNQSTMLDSDFLQIKNISKGGPRKKIEKTDLELEIQSTDENNLSVLRSNDARETLLEDDIKTNTKEVEPRKKMFNYDTTLNTKPPEIMTIKNLENTQDNKPPTVDFDATKHCNTKEKQDQLDTIIADLKSIKTESNLRRIEGQLELYNVVENKEGMHNFNLFNLKSAVPKENHEQAKQANIDVMQEQNKPEATNSVNTEATDVQRAQETIQVPAETEQNYINIAKTPAMEMQKRQEAMEKSEEPNLNQMNLANIAATELQGQQESINTPEEIKQQDSTNVKCATVDTKEKQITVNIAEESNQNQINLANVADEKQESMTSKEMTDVEMQQTQAVMNTPEKTKRSDIHLANMLATENQEKQGPMNVPEKSNANQMNVLNMTTTEIKEKQEATISPEETKQHNMNIENTAPVVMQGKPDIKNTFEETKQNSTKLVNMAATEMQPKQEAMNTSEQANESAEKAGRNYAHITYTENQENATKSEKNKLDGEQTDMSIQKPMNTNKVQSTKVNESHYGESVIADLNRPNEVKFDIKPNELNLTNTKSTETLKDEKEAVVNVTKAEPCLDDYYENTCANGPENTILTNMTAFKPKEDLDAQGKEAKEETTITESIAVEEKLKEMQEQKPDTKPVDKFAKTEHQESNEINDLLPPAVPKISEAEKVESDMDYKLDYPYEPINSYCQHMTCEPAKDDIDYQNQSCKDKPRKEQMAHTCEGSQCFDPKININDQNTSESSQIHRNDILPCHYDYNPVLTVAGKPRSPVKPYQRKAWLAVDKTNNANSFFDKAVIHSADKDATMDTIEDDDCTAELNQFYSVDRSHCCTGSTHPLCMKPNDTTRCYTNTDIIGGENVIMTMNKNPEDNKKSTNETQKIKEQKEKGAQDDETGAQEELLVPDKPKVYKTGLKKNLKDTKDFGSLHMLSESSYKKPDVFRDDINVHESTKLPMKSKAWILKARPHEGLHDTEEIFSHKHESVLSSSHGVEEKARETTIADITDSLISPEKLKTALDSLNEKIRHNISTGIGPITLPNQPSKHGHVPLSRMMRDLRMKNRLEYCLLFEKQLRDYQATLQADAATGKCGDKKVTCPPPAPLCPPPAPTCPPPKPKCPPCPEKKMPACPPKKDPCASKKKDPCAHKKKNPCPPKKKDPCAKFTKKNVSFSDFFIVHKLPSEKLFPPIEIDVRKQYCKKTENSILPFEDSNDRIKGTRDFEPWIPIPSWPYPMPPHKRPTCPPKGCMPPLPSHYHQPCPLKSNPKPCTGFPKRLTFSNVNPRKILETMNEKHVFDIGEF